MQFLVHPFPMEEGALGECCLTPSSQDQTPPSHPVARANEIWIRRSLIRQLLVGQRTNSSCRPAAEPRHARPRRSNSLAAYVDIIVTVMARLNRAIVGCGQTL